MKRLNSLSELLENTKNVVLCRLISVKAQSQYAPQLWDNITLLVFMYRMLIAEHESIGFLVVTQMVHQLNPFNQQPC